MADSAFDPIAAVSGARAAAAAHAAQLGQPTRSLEDWRYVVLNALAEPGATAPTHQQPTRDAILSWLSDDAHTLVLCDGHQVALSRAEWPASWHLDIPEAQQVAQWLQSSSDPTRAWSVHGDGVVQRITVRGQVHAPLRIVSLVSGSGAWHVAIHLADGATLDCEIIHVPLGTQALRLHAGMDVHVGRGAAVRISETISARWPGVLTSALSCAVHGQGSVQWNSAHRGGTLVRQRLDVRLLERGADVAIHAATVVGGRDQAHLLTRVQHHAATTSRQYVKQQLDDAACTSLDALVHMDHAAADSDADLQHRSLVRSPAARADSRPQLDIRIDAVKAAHGSTIGALDPDELFYLRARGFSAAAANSVLAQAFLDDVLNAMSGARALARRSLGLDSDQEQP